MEAIVYTSKILLINDDDDDVTCKPRIQTEIGKSIFANYNNIYI